MKIADQLEELEVNCAALRSKPHERRVWAINGDFVTLKPNGVARYAREVTIALDELVAAGHPSREISTSPCSHPATPATSRSGIFASTSFRNIAARAFHKSGRSYSCRIMSKAGSSVSAISLRLASVARLYAFMTGIHSFSRKATACLSG